MTTTETKCPRHGWRGHQPDVPTHGGGVLCLCGALYTPPDGDRDGATYSPRKDRAPLNAQAQRVWDVLAGGRWLTLAEIAAETGDPEASVSARLRDFRKPKFGEHEVSRRRRADHRVWEYRLVVETTTETPNLPGLS